MEAKRLNNISVAEYIAIEKETQTKHEYHDGELFAMAGGTLEHGIISGNTFGEIKFALRKKKSNSRALNSDVKLYIQTSNKFLYPDVMVVCGEFKISDDEAGAVLNPIVIVEVLSKSTEGYDRGDKFFIYKDLPSLMEYILVDQYKAQVEIYSRRADLWSINRISGLDQHLEINTIGITLDLKNIYEDVSFQEK
jgi:Uma2 family endonuclease